MKKILMLVATLGSVYVSHASQASTLGSNGNTRSWWSQLSELAQDPRVREAKESLSSTFGRATDTGAVTSLEQQRADAQMAAQSTANNQDQNGIMEALSSWLSPEDSVTRQQEATRANRQAVGTQAVGTQGPSYWQQSQQQLQNQQQPVQNRSFSQQQVEQGLGIWKTLQDWWNGRSVNTGVNNPAYAPAGMPTR